MHLVPLWKEPCGHIEWHSLVSTWSKGDAEGFKQETHDPSTAHSEQPGGQFPSSALSLTEIDALSST